VDTDGEIHLGASASNENRVSASGHSRDSETATLFASKLGLDGSRNTPLGNQY
jgi:hypothetical protein